MSTFCQQHHQVSKILVEDYKYASKSISKQAYTMLRNDIEADIQNDQSTGHHNWAKVLRII